MFREWSTCKIIHVTCCNNKNWKNLYAYHWEINYRTSWGSLKHCSCNRKNLIMYWWNNLSEYYIKVKKKRYSTVCIVWSYRKEKKNQCFIFSCVCVHRLCLEIYSMKRNTWVVNWMCRGQWWKGRSPFWCTFWTFNFWTMLPRTLYHN